MTTRAGRVALIGSAALLLCVYLLPGGWPSTLWLILPTLLVLLIGALAARFAGSHELWRCTVLGLQAGALTASFLYCFWFAAAIYTPGVSVSVLLHSLVLGFLALFVIVSSLAALGGLLYGLSIQRHPDEFNLDDPQMVLNASLTADIATLFALIFTTAFYSRLAAAYADASLLHLPLLEVLALLLLIQLCLTLVLPHETGLAWHRPGLDEVRMAAFIDIATAPLAILFISLLAPLALSFPWVIGLLAGSGVLSLMALLILLHRIQPRRHQMPVPDAKALWFGSIGSSHAGRLITLCFGCGIVLVLPFSIPLISVLLNFAKMGLFGNTPLFDQLSLGKDSLALWQGLVNGGAMLAAGGVLSAIYLFYLFLGRKLGRGRAEY